VSMWKRLKKLSLTERMGQRATSTKKEKKSYRAYVSERGEKFSMKPKCKEIVSLRLPLNKRMHQRQLGRGKTPRWRSGEGFVSHIGKTLKAFDNTLSR